MARDSLSILVGKKEEIGKGDEGARITSSQAPLAGMESCGTVSCKTGWGLARGPPTCGGWTRPCPQTSGEVGGAGPGQGPGTAGSPQEAPKHQVRGRPGGKEQCS